MTDVRFGIEIDENDCDMELLLKMMEFVGRRMDDDKMLAVAHGFRKLRERRDALRKEIEALADEALVDPWGNS